LVRGVGFSLDGQTLVTCGAGDDQTVRVWDVSTGQAKHIFKPRGPAMGLALSPDGRTLAVCVWHVVRLYEFGSWKELGTLAGHQHVLQRIAFSPDGKLLASASIDATIKLWNLAAKQEVATLRGHVDAVNGVAFSVDGKILASVGRDKTVRLWRAPSFAEIEAAEKRQK
jgi:WD40 repeat protein